MHRRWKVIAGMWLMHGLLSLPLQAQQPVRAALPKPIYHAYVPIGSRAGPMVGTPGRTPAKEKASAGPIIRSRTIFIPDRRKFIDNKQLLAMVGGMFSFKDIKDLQAPNPEVWEGTAFLVGPDLVVTNAHVVFDDDGKQFPAIRFAAGLDHSKPLAVSAVTEVWPGTNHPGKNGLEVDPADDWAICRLADRLGERYGWMAVAATASYARPEDFPGPLALCGYPADLGDGLTASVDSDVHIRRVLDGWLLHDGETNHGASGSPILLPGADAASGRLTYTVYGLVAAAGSPATATTYTDAAGNIAVRVDRFLPMLRMLLGMPQSAADAAKSATHRAKGSAMRATGEQPAPVPLPAATD